MNAIATKSRIPRGIILRRNRTGSPLKRRMKSKRDTPIAVPIILTSID
jgi:hypothetical protein